MVSKSGGEVEVFDYHMSIHFGICAHTEGLELLAVKYGEKEIWRGSLVTPATRLLNKPDLFGGPKKEGGIGGMMWWLPGRVGQMLPHTLAARLGLTQTTCPGFRGLSSLFFTGIRDLHPDETPPTTGSLSSRRGFYWGSNNPYLRPLSARVRRAPVGLNPTYALIQIEDDSNGNEQYAANGAHIIYECLTNTDWGMGENPAVIDKGSFEDSALTLYNEGFGLNMIWSRSGEIQTFINEVLTHIHAAMFVNPATGKHTLKLLRADYDPLNLPVIDPSNARLSSFKRKMWGEVSNEVSVTYTNPETSQNATVSAQDLAGIAAQGAVINTSKDYHAISSEALAIKVAERDLAAAVNPIATCEAEISREFWDTVSSDVVSLSWPEYNIEEIIFRVSEVNKGPNSVTLSLYEDIFGLDRASYLSAGGTNWVNPSQPPQPATYFQVGTAPAFMVAMAMGLTDPSDLEYPEAMSAVTVGADSADDIGFDLVSYVTDVNGTTTRRSFGARPFNPTFVLLGGLDAEATSTLTELPGLRGAEPDAGDFILIGMEGDDHVEIATVQSYVEGTGFTLNRGMLDTVPKSWAAGTRAFVVPAQNGPADPTIRSAGEATSYWFLTQTSVGTLALEDAPQINVTVSDRPYRPNRPANVKINDVAFGPVDASGETHLNVTWANRNRTLESTQAMKWEEADVTPEVGQTTKITVRTMADANVAQYPGLTGNEASIPVSELGSGTVKVRVTAVRDGLESLQAAEFIVTLS